MFIVLFANALISADFNVQMPNCQEISSTVMQIISEQSDSIQHQEEERLYLKADQVLATK